jgi:hypothetical protein
MQRHLLVRSVLLGIFVSAFAHGGTLPLDQVVPDYIEGDLETAILPAPRQADLKNQCIELSGGVICVAPAPLVTAGKKMAEFGFAEKRKAILEAKFDAPAKRNAALTRLDDDCAKACSGTEKNWPDLFRLIRTLQAIFPDLTIVASQPEPADKALLVLAIPGDAPPDGLALPDVKNPKTAGEAYALSTAARADGKPAMTVYGASPWGLLWGVMTLRQMVFAKEGKLYVREGRVQDWPEFWFRGGKRGKEFWGRYKGNASFGGAEWGFTKEPLYTTHGWWVSANPKTVSDIKQAFGNAAAKNASVFLIDYNDGDFRTKENPDEPCAGDAAKTVKYLLDMLDEERKRLNSTIRIGYMGSAYSLGHQPYSEGKALKQINALEKADVMVHNGLEVFTFAYPEKAAETYRETFGFKGDLVLYDCQCLRKPLDPFDLQDKGVYRQLAGVSLQNASYFFAVCALDYAWNPQAYDPERALKIACREWSERDPELYKACYELIAYWRSQDFIKEYVSRDKLLQMEAQITDGLLARVDKLVPLLEARGRSEDATFFTAADTVSEIGHRPSRRKLFYPLMQKHGFPEYHVQRVTAPIAIDGKLDEDAWKNAATMEGFIQPGYRFTKPEKGKDWPETLSAIKPLPLDGRNVVARALYADDAIYYSFVISGVPTDVVEKIREKQKEKGAVPTHTPACWRMGPTVELYVNPDFTHIEYWQTICTTPNAYTGVVSQRFDPADPTFVWNPKVDFRFVLQDDSTLVFEGKLPLDQKLPPPKKGAIWNADMQVYGFWKGLDPVRWAFSYETWGPVPFRRYGRWIFE